MLRVKRFESQIRRVLRYQRGNQNPYIKEEQTTQSFSLVKNPFSQKIGKSNNLAQ